MGSSLKHVSVCRNLSRACPTKMRGGQETVKEMREDSLSRATQFYLLLSPSSSVPLGRTLRLPSVGGDGSLSLFLMCGRIASPPPLTHNTPLLPGHPPLPFLNLQDFYENLFLSEKIVDGHVKLSLVRATLERVVCMRPPSQSFCMQR